MRIAFIGQKGIPIQSGGVERRVQELSVRMAKMGHEVFVYARKDYTPKNISKFKGVNLIHLPHIATKNLGAISHTFLATVHAIFQNYDVVHYQAPGPSSLSWMIKFFRPKIALIATFNSRDSQHQKWGRLAKFYLNISEWIISKVPDKTIVVSEVLRDYVKRKFKKEFIVIHNGSFVRSVANQNEIKKWNLENKKYFLSVSRLIKHKGIHYLIKAFNNGQKKDRIPRDFKLVIVGDGAFTEDYVAYLKKISSQNKSIIFTENQTGEHLAQLFYCAYAFVQPSEAEGLSNALLEAMGYGLAPIVSDIPENMIPVGQNGIVFKRKNIKDLENKLTLAVRSSVVMEKLGIEAKKNVETNYNWDENALRTIRIYEEVILKKKGYFGRLLQRRPV